MLATVKVNTFAMFQNADHRTTSFLYTPLAPAYFLPDGI